VTPEVWAHIIRITKEEAPNTRVVMHTHNAFGLGGASALAGIRAGADMVEVAANHVCSGTGQADLAEVVAALEVLYGVHTGINIERLTPLARLVEDITGVDLALNHPITGKLAYTYATEAIREEENYAPVHKPVNPQIFGNKAIWMLGPLSATSGQAYVGELLEANGISLPEDKLSDVYMKLRSMMYLRRRTLNDDELLDAARTYLIKD
jgi:isopropylmalate/homocitrate/citramalate synthase